MPAREARRCPHPWALVTASTARSLLFAHYGYRHNPKVHRALRLSAVTLTRSTASTSKVTRQTAKAKPKL